MTICDLLLRITSRSETDPGYQEDNAPCHVSARANEWKRDNAIGTYDGQPKVQISTLLKMFGKPLKKGRISEIENGDDLKCVVQEILTALLRHYIQSLNASIPKRASYVSEAK